MKEGYELLNEAVGFVGFEVREIIACGYQDILGAVGGGYVAEAGQVLIHLGVNYSQLGKQLARQSILVPEIAEHDVARPRIRVIHCVHKYAFLAP